MPVYAIEALLGPKEEITTRLLKTVRRSTLRLSKHLFQFDSPTRAFNFFLLIRFMLTNSVPEGTLLHRILSFGISPINVLYIFQYQPEYYNGH
jgi:hypothetical protein